MMVVAKTIMEKVGDLTVLKVPSTSFIQILSLHLSRFLNDHYEKLVTVEDLKATKVTTRTIRIQPVSNVKKEKK